VLCNSTLKSSRTSQDDNPEARPEGTLTAVDLMAAPPISEAVSCGSPDSLAGVRISHRNREVHPGIKESRHHLHVVQSKLKAEDQCIQSTCEHVGMFPVLRPGSAQILNKSRIFFALQDYVHGAFSQRHFAASLVDRAIQPNKKANRRSGSPRYGANSVITIHPPPPSANCSSGPPRPLPRFTPPFADQRSPGCNTSCGA
jgi:hypothetical protein